MRIEQIKSKSSSCQPSGLGSCTPEACEDGSPGCASDSEPPRVGDHTKSAPRQGCEEPDPHQ